jgi:hypothetical protein
MTSSKQTWIDRSDVDSAVVPSKHAGRPLALTPLVLGGYFERLEVGQEEVS